MDDVIHTFLGLARIGLGLLGFLKLGELLLARDERAKRRHELEIREIDRQRRRNELNALREGMGRARLRSPRQILDDILLVETRLAANPELTEATVVWPGRALGVPFPREQERMLREMGLWPEASADDGGIYDNEPRRYA